ncbi:F-type H+-transporting ATPase subunit delta [Parabacteroides sp. PF5-5]|uniref:F0F1 ATP synthase subunit delta n=1 Tax=unclassified Parabacteroides TaxID=2649774 RepID=UPI002473849A|nr:MULTISPECIES: F0F1 ATP synthase subunit delta [unclassified Parabacteroides]MDH6304750.1 F-type H+-transporting ATPase subunit delta [Parabacteroides sp. PH5-39]MDH6315635.1 F-type H+-transporting ATPase subunit delta [Parabacteroides sp. PF5-13]MDH6319296.1 F-type H+-transporting ATPase subunit delta [Parabacteroides sp. PH5-13]MDH6323027.1 F-type H+-transporting ATPase subunit delta [Parabacteroides sp. PH5-8]MDH6326828.1 F-type H+-transporting ATPase subunit delta [Parabacteroides sp. PH
MDIGMISRRYAEALLMYAQKRGKDKDVYYEARMVSRVYREYPALRRVMSNLMLTPTKKVEIINACTPEELSDEMGHFLRLLIREKREEFLQEICLSYEKLFREANNWHDVHVITAIPLEEETEQKLKRRLEKYINGTVNLYTKVNPALIGGYAVLWDTYRMDASVASRLKRIEKRLIDTTNN